MQPVRSQVWLRGRCRSYHYLAFVHDWFVLNDGLEVVTDILQPRAVVLMHHRWERAAETRLRVEQLPAEIASTLPPVTVLGSELDSAAFEPRPR